MIEITKTIKVKCNVCEKENRELPDFYESNLMISNNRYRNNHFLGEFLVIRNGDGGDVYCSKKCFLEESKNKAEQKYEMENNRQVTLS